MVDTVVNQVMHLNQIEKDVERKDVINKKMPWIYEKGEKQSFPEIDRKKEDSDILKYQETGDESILNDIYEIRVPTLKKWARQYYYLSDSEDDMFAEFRQVFLKAVGKYKKHKRKKTVKDKEVWTTTPFNTYLWFSLDHAVQNIRNFKRAKKRRPLGSDPNSISNFTLSLDYDYGGEDGESTLKDIIANSMETSDNVLEQMSMDDALNVLASDDELIRDFLIKLSAGVSVAALLREYKTHAGYVMVDKEVANRLRNNKRCTRIVSNILLQKQKVSGKFKLLGYSIKGNHRLYYKVELHKTPEADKITRALRQFKRDKTHILCRLNS